MAQQLYRYRAIEQKASPVSKLSYSTFSTVGKKADEVATLPVMENVEDTGVGGSGATPGENQNRTFSRDRAYYIRQDTGILLDEISLASSYNLLNNSGDRQGCDNNKSKNKTFTTEDEKLSQLLQQSTACASGACMPTALICQITQHEDVKVC